MYRSFFKICLGYSCKNKICRKCTSCDKTSATECRPSELFQTDEGKEFYNKPIGDYLKSLGIHHFSVHSKMKAAMVEWFNKTLKTCMWHVFTTRGNYKWIDVVQDLVDSYNSTVHSAIGLAPINVDP